MVSDSFDSYVEVLRKERLEKRKAAEEAFNKQVVELAKKYGRKTNEKLEAEIKKIEQDLKSGGPHR